MMSGGSSGGGWSVEAEAAEGLEDWVAVEEVVVVQVGVGKS